MSTLRIPTPRAFHDFLRPSRYKAAFGGRGSGKSHFFGGAAVSNSIGKEGLRTVCIREVQKTLKESAKRLIEDKIEKYKATGFRILNDHIITPGNGLMLFQGMQDHTAESIKSLEGFDVAWVEEAHTMSKKSWELLRPTIREPGSEIWANWNPRHASDPVDAFFRGENPPPNAIIRKVNYMDNPFFPSELEEERRWDEEFNRQRYGHIWLGDYEPTAVGAIWDRLTFHNGRVGEAPTMGRILVSVDPAASNEDGSNEHGIICGGQGEDQRGYVLEDGSLKGTPRQWADRTVALFDKHDADAVVIERNQGGDMCRHTLQSVRPSLPIIEVVATRGKHVRAEPISSLYTLGQISHVGSFPELEDQMCQMTASGYEGEGSPDRVDALVWLFTELFPKLTKKKGKKPKGVQPLGAGGWMA